MHCVPVLQVSSTRARRQSVCLTLPQLTLPQLTVPQLTLPYLTLPPPYLTTTLPYLTTTLPYLTSGLDHASAPVSLRPWPRGHPQERSALGGSTARRLRARMPRQGARAYIHMHTYACTHACIHAPPSADASSRCTRPSMTLPHPALLISPASSNLLRSHLPPQISSDLTCLPKGPAPARVPYLTLLTLTLPSSPCRPDRTCLLQVHSPIKLWFETAVKEAAPHKDAVKMEAAVADAAGSVGTAEPELSASVAAVAPAAPRPNSVRRGRAAAGGARSRE